MQMIDSNAIERAGDWCELTDWLLEAHRGPQATLEDLLLKQQDKAWLSRAAWFEGGDLGLKSVTVFPSNVTREPPLPSVNGAFLLFDGETGLLRAVLDGAALTTWKTVGDSILGARLLARPDSRTLVIAGAGTIAARLPEAYAAILPALERIMIWNRSRDRAQTLAATLADLVPSQITVVSDLETAVHEADIVACATMTVSPILKGAWLKPGSHVDLIGAYRPDMREADDETLRRARIFVDARATTVHDIGELMIPLADGVIGEADVLGDLYDLATSAPGRVTDQEITLFKNGGGAHLDVMTAQFILNRVGDR